MKAPLSPSARTGSRLERVRLRMKLLLDRKRGRSQVARFGVSDRAVANDRSRSTPTGSPSKKRRSL